MSYVEEHFLIEKFRLIREEQEALLSILSKELSKMPELGLFPTEPGEAPQIPRIGSFSPSMLSTRLHKARLMAEHLIKRIIDRYMEFEEKLARSLSDPDSRALMRGQINELLDGGPELLDQHKKAILEYHQKNETEGVIKDSYDEYSKIIDSYRLDEEDLDLMFSGLENHGRFIDLYKFYEVYLSLSGSHMGYLAFLKVLSNIPLEIDRKMTSSYSSLVNDMIAYFKSFIERAFPLVLDFPTCLDERDETFEKNWYEGIYPEDWANPIAELSLVQPKSDLYCLPCQHLFTNRSVYEAHLKGKKHLKASERCKEGYIEAEAVEKVLHQYKQTRLDAIKEVARTESKLKCIIELLNQVINDTIQDLERKQAMTPEEIQREEALIAQQDEEFYWRNIKGDSSESSKKKKKLTDYKDELPQELFNGGVYNPLKLPLDWDGKPIPYWLWKLHGLGTKYPCEVCGGYEYAGRKAFDAHFSEWRHSHGLKCLGIPSTKHFFHVTKISEAIALWDKLKTQARTEIFRPEAMEEVEDHLGNVYVKRTFEDLQKQGLI